MRIKEIHIYGYGRFHDFHLNNIAQMQLFFGENEAGKSTIMSFIHSILFGFPTLLQSELRLEPKTHSSYGGKLVLETENYGEVLIERVKGKAAGDVTIQLGDGTLESEEFLRKSLLKGMDKSMFRSIFSFNLQGLQEVQRLKEEEIGKYLVAAGTIGTDQFLRIEQGLHKELQQLFKPGGRKPVLNDQLKKLRQQEQQLKSAKQQNAAYGSLLEEIDTISKRVKERQTTLQEEKMRLSSLEDTLRKWPLMKEKEQLQVRFNKLAEIEFPPDGINRLEQYIDRQLELSSTLQTVQERIKLTKKQISSHVLLHGFNLNRADAFVREWPKVQQRMEEISDLKRSIADDQDEYERIVKELHYSAHTEDAVQELNLSIDMKARMKESLYRYMRFEGQMTDFQELLQNEMKTANEIEKACAEIEEQLVSEDTFREWKKYDEMLVSAEQLDDQIRTLKKDIHELEQKKIRESKKIQQKKKNGMMYSAAFFLVCTVGIIWSMVSRQWLPAMLALAGMVYAAAPFIKRSDANQLDLINENLHIKREQLSEAEELRDRSSSDNRMAQRYKEQLKLREEWKRHFSRSELQSQRVIEITEQIHQLKESIRTEEMKLDEIKAALRLDVDYSYRKVEDAFELLKQLQQLDRRLINQSIQLKQGIQEQEEWGRRLYELISSIHVAHEPGQAIFLLQETIKNEQEKKIVLKELEKKLMELQVDELQLQNELSGSASDIQQLLKAAKVNDEEAFRKKAKLHEEKNRIHERLFLLNTQVQDKTYGEFLTSEELQTEMNHLKQLIEEYADNIERDRNELASLHQKVSFLEEGGTYTDNLHRFQQMRSTFNEGAKHWAQLTVAAHILRQVMEKYKEDRFPQVMKKAEEYFSFLTEDEYQRVLIQKNGSLLVERHDRMLFGPEELSKGTGEQLYIAIRLGLVHVLKEEYPFPVMIDDGFVNFDRKRTKRVLQLIQTLSSNNTQVLFFTCHQHIAEQLSEGRTTFLQEWKSLQPNVMK